MVRILIAPHRDSRSSLRSVEKSSMLTRRCFLGHTALGSLSLALTSLSASASAQQLAHAQVGYQDQPHDGKRCELCIHFLKPNGCKLVTGPISPQGWCRLFSASS